MNIDDRRPTTNITLWSISNGHL